MLFAIFAIDKPGMAEKRAEVMPAHRNYLDNEAPITIVTSGPLVSDDGETVIGSLYIVEAEGRDQMDEFQKNDPLFEADIWKQVDICRYIKRVGNPWPEE